MIDVVIIGGGPAGLTAAIYSTRAGLDLLLLEGGQLGGQVAVSAEVENYPAVPHTMGWMLANSMAQQIQAMNIPVQYDTVTAVTREEDHFLVTTTRDRRPCRAVIVANGAKRRKLGCPGEDHFLGRGVSYCATCDGAFFRGKDVAVAGGGNTALEDALYLSNICRSVHLIFRRDQVTAQRPLVEAVAKRDNVHLTPHTTVSAVQGEGAVASLELTDIPSGQSRTLPVDALFVAIGLEPDNGIVGDAVARDAYGYIIAGEDCATNVPGLFVAGDSRTKLLRQIVTAVADGAVAAMQVERYLK